VESGLSSDDDFPRSSVLRVLKTNITSDNHTLKKYKVEMSVGALSLWVKAGLNDASAFPAPTLMIQWIPAPIIDYAFPDLVSRSLTSARLGSTKARSKLPTRNKSRRMPHTRAPIAGPSRISGMYCSIMVCSVLTVIRGYY
jgi:hypothetical protein